MIIFEVLSGIAVKDFTVLISPSWILCVLCRGGDDIRFFMKFTVMLFLSKSPSEYLCC